LGDLRRSCLEGSWATGGRLTVVLGRSLNYQVVSTLRTCNSHLVPSLQCISTRLSPPRDLFVWGHLDGGVQLSSSHWEPPRPWYATPSSPVRHHLDRGVHLPLLSFGAPSIMVCSWQPLTLFPFGATRPVACNFGLSGSGQPRSWCATSPSLPYGARSWRATAPRPG